MGKILYITAPEADFQSSLIYKGLCNVLGVENVVDFPLKKSYHGETERYSLKPIYGTDEEGVTAPFEWFIAEPYHNWTVDEIGNNAEVFDFVILESVRKLTGEVYEMLCANYPKINSLPMAIIDGEDYGGVVTEFKEKNNCIAYFKRELTVLEKNVYPFPFSTPVPQYYGRDWTEKKDNEELNGMNVLCSFNKTHPQRDVFKNAMDGSSHTLIRKGLCYADYLSALSKARIALSVRGWGWDTLRRWEIASFKTLLFTDQLGIIDPNPYRDRVHCVYVTPDDVVEKGRYYLDHPEEAMTIAKAGQAHTLEYHTPEKRVKDMLKILVEKS